MTHPELDAVETFWQAIDTHDWDLISTVLADDFVRVGMRGDASDTCTGKDDYIRFVSQVTGKMDHHDLKMTRRFYSEDRRTAIAECVESIQPPGESELNVMTFLNVMEIGEDGLITKLDIFWKTPRQMPPDWITVDSILSDASS